MKLSHVFAIALWAVGLIVFAMYTPAQARPATESVFPQYSLTGTPKPKKNKYRKQPNSAKYYKAGPRPGRWCGWWMRTQKGGGPEYNLARNWAKRGVSAGGPKVGAIVVWRGHVGLITGKSSKGRWIVKSGNDGGKVRERARSISGAIAFRLV